MVRAVSIVNGIAINAIFYLTKAEYRKIMKEFVKKALEKSIEVFECITVGWSVMAKR
jgi:hypothetical protein